MRTHFSYWTILAIPGLFSTSSALPFSQFQEPKPKALDARASYSVVPVDGGGSTNPTGGNGAGSQATVTIIQTTTLSAPKSPASTVTMVEKETIKPAVLTVTSIVEKTIAAEAVTVTSISKASIEADAHTVTVTFTPSTPSEEPAPPIESLASASKSYPPEISEAAVSTKSFDNGMWHTTYSAWWTATSTYSSQSPQSTTTSS